jgi:hypothetical protein
MLNFIDRIFIPMTIIDHGHLGTFSVLGMLFITTSLLYLFNIDRMLAIGFFLMLSLFFVNFLVGYQYAWWHFGVVYCSIILYLRVGYLEVTQDGQKKVNPKSHYAIGVFFFLISFVVAFENIQGPGYSMLKNENYSNSWVVANYIRENCNDECTIVQDTDFSGAGISALLGGRSIYYLNASKFGTYTVWKKENRLTSEAAANHFSALDLQDCILIKNPESEAIFMDTEYLFTTRGAIQPGEDFELRRCIN